MPRDATGPRLALALGAFGEALLDLLLPPACGGCGQLLAWGLLCEACAAQLEPIRSPRCPRCGVPFEGAGEDHPCGDCLLRPPPFASTSSAFVYDGPLAEGLRALKYGPAPERIGPLAALWREASPPLPRGLDLALAVPLHRGDRLRRRGFNQAALLARPLLRARRIPLVHGRLQRVRGGPSQASLGDADRRDAPRGAFAVPGRRAATLRDRRVLLVDDIMTTGGTAAECARVLLAAGAAEVHLATLARTVKWR